MADDEASETSQAMPARSADSRLSTAEAAKLIGTSQAYITMLCDNGKLGPIEMTDEGRRQIKLSSIEQYRELSVARYSDAPTPRQAGIDAGLYDHEDSHYVNVVRSEDASGNR